METTSEGSSLVQMESSYSKRGTRTMRRNLMRVDENQANSNRQRMSEYVRGNGQTIRGGESSQGSDKVSNDGRRMAG